MSESTLEQRLQRLEAIEGVRAVKARYCNACDTKDVDALRECFIADGAVIDYGPIGRFEGRDALVAVYKELGCQPGVVDMHHVGNAEIEIIDDTHARARWALYFFTMIEGMNAVRQLGGHYEDTYRRDDGVWRMETSVFRAHSILDGHVAAGGQITWYPGGRQDAHPA
jgi:hypothetical protein